MRYLVDANVLSEPTKSKPAHSVLKWLQSNEAEICVNPIVVGEMKYGILKLPPGKKRQALLDWFETGIVRIPVVKLDLETANCWAALLSDLQKRGKAMPVKDSLIAASALQYDLVVVTRNVKDFQSTSLQVVNPF
ncbi:MAG: type II toxin-antitoxin system VapC family toxin [Candidatus Eremiobacteraeota bacterium]|nr:type II toxin-antitoxin system VapC family toxin [Candidatus Eremiobacteraeota bacterium]